VTALKDVLIVCGAFYVSIRLLLPLSLLWSLVSNDLSFAGNLQLMLLMPIVMAVPEILAAIAVGTATALTVESRYPSRWAVIPALLFLQGQLFVQRTWIIGPTTDGLVGVAVEAALPAIACIVAAAVVEERRLDLRSQKILNP
jgi:hypothetical protein